MSGIIRKAITVSTTTGTSPWIGLDYRGKDPAKAIGLDTNGGAGTFTVLVAVDSPNDVADPLYYNHSILVDVTATTISSLEYPTPAVKLSWGTASSLPYIVYLTVVEAN
jgi:hypothetical protein